MPAPASLARQAQTSCFVVTSLPDEQVRVVASLPCYSSENVDQQRGMGVFQRSIRGLQLLNAVGYGQPGSGLHLDLVYNPNGVFLAPPQSKLQVLLHGTRTCTCLPEG